MRFDLLGDLITNYEIYEIGAITNESHFFPFKGIFSEIWPI